VFAEALRFQPAPDAVTGEILIAGFETGVEFHINIAQQLPELGFAASELSLFKQQYLAVLLVAGQFLFHVADCLPEQYLGFLDAVEHGMEICLEQTRDACDQCHDVYLLRVDPDVNPVWACGRRGCRQALVKPVAGCLQKIYMPGVG
jgi:hypothetical protein